MLEVSVCIMVCRQVDIVKSLYVGHGYSCRGVSMRIAPASSDVIPLDPGALPGRNDEVALAAFLAKGVFKQLLLATISSRM